MQATDQISTSLSFLKRHLVGLLGVLLLLSWASLLTLYTVQIQHSCQPLLEWTDISAKKCPPIVGGSDLETNRGEPHGNGQHGHESGNNGEGNELSKIVTASVAASVAVVGLAVIGAPITVVAGVGIAVWFAAKTLLALSG